MNWNTWVSVIALFGWEVMTAAERFAAIGGAAGLISVIVSAAMAWDNRRSMRKQLDIAAEANATAKLAVDNQMVANEVTKRSVDDQLATSQLARSASVRIGEIGMCDRETATTNGDLAAIDWVVPDTDFNVLTVTLINEGMGPAYKTTATPLTVGWRELTYHHNAGWRVLEEGQGLWDAMEPFASRPVGMFLSIPPGHTDAFRVAVRLEAFDMSARGPFFAAEYQLEYEDGLGTHKRSYQFRVAAGDRHRAKGWVDTAETGGTQNGQG